MQSSYGTIWTKQINKNMFVHFPLHRFFSYLCSHSSPDCIVVLFLNEFFFIIALCLCACNIGLAPVKVTCVRIDQSDGRRRRWLRGSYQLIYAWQQSQSGIGQQYYTTYTLTGWRQALVRSRYNVKNRLSVCRDCYHWLFSLQASNHVTPILCFVIPIKCLAF